MNVTTATAIAEEIEVTPADIENFHLEDDIYIVIRTYPVIPGVVIRTYGDDSAEMRIGQADIPFALNAETRPIIENIDEFEAVELLALLEAHGIE
ncbi:hypothetical protein [Salibacterium sp. K-3]